MESLGAVRSTSEIPESFNAKSKLLLLLGSFCLIRFSLKATEMMKNAHHVMTSLFSKNFLVFQNSSTCLFILGCEGMFNIFHRISVVTFSFLICISCFLPLAGNSWLASLQGFICMSAAFKKKPIKYNTEGASMQIADKKDV